MEADGSSSGAPYLAAQFAVLRAVQRKETIRLNISGSITAQLFKGGGAKTGSAHKVIHATNVWREHSSYRYIGLALPAAP